MAHIYIIANSITNADSMSGGDKNFIMLATLWRKAGHSITIVTCPEGEKMCLANQVEATYYLLPDINIQTFGIYLTYVFRLIASIKILATKLPENTPIMCISSSNYLTDVFPGFLLKLKNRALRWGMFLHLIFPNPLKGFTFAFRKSIQLPRFNETLNWFFQFPSLLLARYFSDTILCVNTSYIELLQKRGYPAKKLAFFPSGVDHNLIDATQPSHQQFDGIFLGRFHPQKGIADLVPIWQEVTRILPTATLGIIGSGPVAICQGLSTAIAKAQLEKVITLLGFKDGEEKFALLKACRVFVFPSYFESFGSAVLDAQACGKPVVAYALPPMQSAFTQGVVFAPVGDVKKFASSIVELLSDAKRYQQTATAAYQHSLEFSWEKTADSVFKSLTGNN